MAAPAADFGEDLSCVTDIDARCAIVTGRRLLAEAIARRLITPRGRLIDDPNYGTDITDMINEDVSRAGLAALQSSIVAECLKDERVETVEVLITVPANGIGAYTIEITLEDTDGPFDMTMAVSAVTVALLEVGP